MGWEKIQPWSAYPPLVHRLVGPGRRLAVAVGPARRLATGPRRRHRRDRRAQAALPLPRDHDGARGRGLRDPAPEPVVERPPPALLLPGHLPAGRPRRRRDRPDPGRCASPATGRSSARTSFGRCRWRRVLCALIWAGAVPADAAPRPHRRRQNRYHWMGLTARDDNFVDGWARWNFTGYEARKPTVDGGGYHEYHDLIETMKDVGTEHGCGRAMWEYEPELVRYGTPDGPDAPAPLDQRVHRLDGGPLLRVVGHHAVPLPQPVRALGRAVPGPAGPALRAASTSPVGSSTSR